MSGRLPLLADEEPSELDPQDTSLRHRQGAACEHILAAFKGESPDHVRRSAAARVVNSAVYGLRHLRWLAVGVLVALSFFERPVWCIQQQRSDGVYPCDLHTFQGFRQGYFSLQSAFVVEGYCLSVLLLLEAGHLFAGGWGYITPRRHWLRLPLLLCALLDMAVAAATPATLLRLAPFFRIAIAANLSADVRRELLLFARILPGLVPLLAATLLFIALFAFAGVVLFHSNPATHPYFGNYWFTMWSLLVLQTSCNFPDVMMGAFNAHRASFFYFLAFILLGTFFLMNLFTAVVYAKYTESEEEHRRDALVMTQVHLGHAFVLLDVDGTGTLSRDEMMATIKELRSAHLLPNTVPAQGAAAEIELLEALDRDGDGRISEPEFQELVALLKRSWDEESEQTYFERFHPRLYRSRAFQRLRALVLHPWFQTGCDLVLLLMCALTVWESAEAVYHPPTGDPRYADGKVDTFWNVVELLFTSFFVLEAALKVTVFGWVTYWRDHMNRLEFVTAVASTLLTAAVYLPSDFDDSRWIRWTLMIRLLRALRFARLARLPAMLRFLRAVLSVQHVRLAYETFVTMLPSAMRLIKFMFCIVFFYAALGVQLFGGLITTDPASSHYARLKGTAYGASGYWAINLNDIPSGLVLMVQLLMVNNWMVFAEAFAAVGGPLAWPYFISFFFVGVVAGLNVLVSFVLDAFVKGLEQDGGDDKAAAAGEAELTRLPPSPPGSRRAAQRCSTLQQRR